PELTPDEARMLFPRSARERYPVNSPVVSQGEAGRDLYVIQSGTVCVTQTFGSAGGQLSNLSAGDIFGEIGLVKDGVRHATVLTMTDSVIFRLAFQDVQYLLKNNAKLGEHLQALATSRS
ncbi:MAG: cyclic nucleotide-binding domain-containing protein, partial [Elusimicrobia bacterium]|nr:cyclic nucleotide-binding domain-containing protein [Elusimicrobiota bacterium]